MVCFYYAHLSVLQSDSNLVIKIVLNSLFFVKRHPVPARQTDRAMFQNAAEGPTKIHEKISGLSDDDPNCLFSVENGLPLQEYNMAWGNILLNHVRTIKWSAGKW